MDQKTERIYYFLLLAAGTVRFWNLGFPDLQAWDEALYAVRSETILLFGLWLDQSPKAIDGLYSSLHPPLYIWFTALSFKLFGVSEFSARLFSTVFGLLTLPVIYLIGKRIANGHVGMIAALLFALNPFVSFYARQGQFDATLVFFLSLAILLLTERQHEQLMKLSFFAGLSTGAALMTKLFVGIGIPFVYGLWIAFQPLSKRRAPARSLMIMLLGIALAALPWHVWMTFEHGKGDPFFFFTASSLIERSVEGVEGNVKPLEVFYFINQLIVLFPLGVVWFGYGMYRLMKKKEQPWNLLAIWFWTFFVVFSLMRTKLAVYLLPMLVPASLIAAKELWRATAGESTRKEHALLVGGTVFSTLWASSQTWRNGVKSILGFIAGFDAPPMAVITSLFFFVALTILCGLLTAYLWKNGMRPRHLSLLPVVLLCAAAAWSLYQTAIVERSGYKDGATELAKFIEENNYGRVVVAGYEGNPQLTYYLRGADIGWRDDLEIRRIIPPKDRDQFRSWMLSELSAEPDETLIVLEKDKFVRYETIDPLRVMPSQYVPVFESRRYSAFHRATLVNYAAQHVNKWMH